MKTFARGAPARLVLPWEPPVRYDDPNRWAAALADNLDCEFVRDLVGHFDFYERGPQTISFYVHPRKRRTDIQRSMRRDKAWRTFFMSYPGAKLEWAEDFER